jgi:hypothetical protein
MNQLDFLNHTPEPVENPLPPPKLKPSSSALWELAKARFYLQMMNRIAVSSLSAEMKRAEVTRLHQLREKALAQCNKLAPTRAESLD